MRRVDIIGAGPAGLALAWFLSADSGVSVRVFEQKESPGGSWVEPGGPERNLHAVRAVFGGCSVNTRALFADMKIPWGRIFTEPHGHKRPASSTDVTTPAQCISARDLMRLLCSFLGCIRAPDVYKKRTLAEECQYLSSRCKKLIKTLSYVFDGVSWDTMTAYEFFETLNFVGLSRQEVLNGSGAKLGRMMAAAIAENRPNVSIRCEQKVVDIQVIDSGHVLTTTSPDDRSHMPPCIFGCGQQRHHGEDLVLCVDAHNVVPLLQSPSLPQRMMPPSLSALVSASTYHAITLVFEYEARDGVALYGDEVTVALNTDWTVVAQELVNDDAVPGTTTTTTIACTVIDLDTRSRHTKTTARDTREVDLIDEVLRQVRLPKPLRARVCWGSTWDNERQEWMFVQSSGVVTTHGPVPDFIEFGGRRIFLCTTMCQRKTPFASLEGAVEVAARISCDHFSDLSRSKIATPHRPWRISDVIAISSLLLALLLVCASIAAVLHNTT